MKVILAGSEYWQKIDKSFQDTYVTSVKKAYKECLKLLPFASKYVNFIVQPREYDYVEETGDGGYSYNSEIIILAFNPHHPGGLDAILSEVRALVFHEMSHVARFELGYWHGTVLEQSVMEGLATVFERDYAGSRPLWARYPKGKIKTWLQEILTQKDLSLRHEYMFEHTDGRKWIGYKVGTYIVDEALKHSGKSIMELTKLETDEILRLAKVV